MDQELKALYGSLYRDGYYSKSYKDFVSQFEDDAYKQKVFDGVSRDGLYTKDFDSFVSKYGSPTSTGEEQEGEVKKDDFTLGPTDMDLPSEEASSDISPEISKSTRRVHFKRKII